MKIFDWMQSRLNAKQKPIKTISKPHNYLLKNESCKEEFNDWPNGLLAIGTFGNDPINKKNSDKSIVEENVSTTNYHQEHITTDEFKELQKELQLLLHKEESSSNTDDDQTKEIIYQSEKKFFDCLRQNLEGDEDVLHIQSKKGNGIRKKSLTYLLKKAIFGKPKLNPMLRDHHPVLVPEMKLEKSRLEKILRALLKKKIYPQNPNSKIHAKKFLEKICSQDSYKDVLARKCLENKYESETDSDVDKDDKSMDKLSEGSKWVKTDSEYIVLEI